MTNQKGNIPIIVGVLIFLIIIGGGVYYLGTQKFFNITQNLPLTTPSPPPCYAEDDSESAYTYPKRQFDIKSKFIGDQDYPSQITSFCDNQLTKMSCLDHPYILQPDGTYRFTEIKKEGEVITSTTLTVTQEDVLDNIHRISRKLGGINPDKIYYCAIDGRDLLAIYEIWENGKESNNETKIALLATQGGVEEITSILNYGVSHFTCDKPLLLTGADHLYIECSGANEVPISKAIYKISLNESYGSKIILNSEVIECSQDQSGTLGVSCEQSNWRDYTIELYGLNLSLPSDWNIVESNRRPEPEGAGAIYNHDCADYQIKNIDNTAIITLQSTCGFDERAGITLPKEAVVIRNVDKDWDIVRVLNNNGSYEYGMNSKTGSGPDTMSYLPTLTINNRQEIITASVNFQFSGSNAEKDIILEIADKIIASLKKS